MQTYQTEFLALIRHYFFMNQLLKFMITRQFMNLLKNKI